MLYKKYKSEIIVGIICTMITTGIFKITNWFKTAVPIAGNSILRLLSNSFFQALAKQTDTTLSQYLYSLVWGVFAAYFVLQLSKGIKGINKVIKDAKDIIHISKSTTEIKPDKKSEHIDDSFSIVETAQEIKKSGQRLRGGAIIIAIFLTLYMTWMFVYHLIPSLSYSSFKRELVKITPYIEAKQIQMLESDWACMQTKMDYEDIDRTITAVKEQHNLP